MKQSWKIAVIGLMLAMGSAFGIMAEAAVYTPATVPSPKDHGQKYYVSNPDSILVQDDVDYLNRCCLMLEDSTDVELAVVVLESIGDYEPFDFGYELFQRWGIGKAGKNTGVLITFALASRQVYINTGSGIEGVLTDAKCKLIIDKDMIPYFKQGDYGGGLCNGATSIYTTCTSGDAPEELLNMVSSTNRGKYAPASSSKKSTGSSNDDFGPMEWGIITVFSFLVLLPFLFMVLFQGKTQSIEEEMSQRDGCLMKLGCACLVMPFLIPSAVWFLWRSKRFRCPNCGKQKYKVIKTEYNKMQNGNTQSIKTWLCSSCGHSEKKITILPKTSYSSGYSGGGYSSDSDYDSSDYSSSDDSSSDWGGGSSSGGGAGGSW